jgi:raffinose/stachyose/melibiose transport system permease protein
MVVFLILPAIVVAAISLTNWIGVGPIEKVVGLRNYRFILDQGGFPDSLRITAIYTVVMTLTTTVLGFLLASLIHRRLRGWRVYKVAWFVPVLIPGTVTAILWSGGVFAPSIGALDTIAARSGLPVPESGWLGAPGLALGAVIVTAVWAYTGWPMLLMSAALEKIPRDYFEAAAIDGAGWLATTWRVTLPLMSPVIATVLTLQLVFGLKVFDIVYVMTGGGPGDYTRVLSVLMWQWAFPSGRFAIGAAVAVLMILIITPLALLQRRLHPEG